MNASSLSFIPRDDVSLYLAAYDDELGLREGEEADKVLGFHPASTNGAVQSGIIGLAQALTTFAETFCKVGSHYTMQAEKMTWVIHRSEPHTWLLMVISNKLAGGMCAPRCLEQHLTTIGSLMKTIFGSNVATSEVSVW